MCGYITDPYTLILLKVILRPLIIPCLQRKDTGFCLIFVERKLQFKNVRPHVQYTTVKVLIHIMTRQISFSVFLTSEYSKDSKDSKDIGQSMVNLGCNISSYLILYEELIFFQKILTFLSEFVEKKRTCRTQSVRILKSHSDPLLSVSVVLFVSVYISDYTQLSDRFGHINWLMEQIQQKDPAVIWSFGSTIQNKLTKKSKKT